MDPNKAPSAQVSISSLLKTLTDAELVVCVDECFHWQRTGKLPEQQVSALERLANRLVSETGVDERDSFQHAENAVFREVARRFVELHGRT